jgi:hypothetical protein
MADERDPKVSRHYRELGTDEPPRHVDEAILAASRRAVHVHPAPLVAPTGRRRWYFPVAAAAIIMLSVAVTWHMQVERPDPNGYVASAPAPAAQQEERKAEVQPAPAAKAFTPDPPRQEARDQAIREAPARAAPQATPQAAPPLPEAAAPPPEVAASRAEERMRESAPMAGARGPEAARADSLFRKQLADEPPERWLERIAELRKQGKHDEADKALEEFRKRYPDYKIPEAALKK